MPIPASHLVQNQGKLVTVALDTKLAQALALMIEHDFSQLPVVDADFKPLGIVTTDSIVRALLTLGTTIKEPRVKDVFTKPPIFRADEDLLYLLDYLLKASAVFIVDNDDKLIGIITDYDTTQYFRQRAEDIVLVEDIESTLKAHLRAVHDAVTEDSEELRNGIATLNSTLDDMRKRSQAALKDFCKNKTIEYKQEDIDLVLEKFFPADKARAFDSLTLSEYIQFAQKAWPKLNSTFNLSKNAWGEMMDAVREIRNKLVHFRGDVSPVERAKLRYCAEWYKTHQTSQKDAPAVDDAPIEPQVDADTQQVQEPTSSPQPPRVAYDYGAITRTINETNAGKDTPAEAFNVYLSTAERVLKAKLPRAAYEHITWWTENPIRNRIWARAGWVVTSANLADSKPYATFRQLPTPSTVDSVAHVMTS